jgi:hypothetical protein
MNRSSIRLSAGLVLLGLSFGNPSAQAGPTNIVVNGGFEAGNFTPWTESGDNAARCFPAVYVASLNQVTSFCNNSVSPFPPNSGLYAAFFNNSAALGAGTISQDLSTTPGTTYDLTFWLATFADPSSGKQTPNQMIVNWGGLQVADIVNLSTNGLYEKFSVNVLATGSSTILFFVGTNDPNVTGLDDVSALGVATTPEPSTSLLLGTGLLAALFFTLKKTIA